MIRLFSHTETDFTHNGIHVLDDIALGDTCILSNGINEVYSLEMEVSIYNNSKWKDIESEMILKVPTPKGEQLFRIKEVVKGFSTIKIYGKHIFFDLENNFILDTNIVKKDGRSAIAQILGAMTNNMVNSFHGTSDISNFNNSRLVRKNVVTALIGDDDNSFLNRWGGELELNNFNFSINQRIGSDRGFQIRYGKNATGYEGNINTYNLCTRIVPVGFDGLMLEGTKWVDSPNIAKYPQIYTYEVKFDDIKVKENEDDEEGYNTIEEAREALREAAVNYFTSTECDLPSFSAIVNFITLRNTEEFKNVKALETVALGDDVSIYLSNIDVNASSRVVREKWNFFTKKHVELEIGEIKPNVFKQLINIKDTIDNIVESLGGNTWQDIINKSLDEATKLMEEGLKGSHVITMKNQIVIGDAPDIKDMVNCIVFNKNGIGFSNNGYLPDRLVSAMTIDGKINASCITTGELNAALIKTGVLMSANGKTWIDMDNGTFNLADKIKFDGTNFDIDLSNKGLATAGDIKTLQTQITANADGIKEKVSADYVSQEITKSAESTIFKFSNSGGMNLVKDGQFKSWEFNAGKWKYNEDAFRIYGRGSNDPEGTSIGFYSATDGKVDLYQYVKFKPDTTYTFRADIYKEPNIWWYAVIIDFYDGSGNYLESHTCTEAGNTFTTPSNCYKGVLVIRHGGTSNFNGNYVLYVNNVAIYEGTMELPYSPHPEEIYEGETKIDANGVTVTNGAFTLYDKNGNKVFYADDNGNLIFTGNLNPSSQTVNLFGNDCRIDGTADAIRMQLNPSNYVAVDEEALRIFNSNSNGGYRYISQAIDTNGHLNIWGDRTRIKLLGSTNERPVIQCRNSSDNAYGDFHGADFLNRSTIEDKTNVSDVDDIDFIKILKENSIRKYNLKADVENELSLFNLNNDVEEVVESSAIPRIGFILEDLTEDARNLLSPNNDSISIYAMCSALWAVVKEQQARIEDLERLIKTEETP